MKKLEQLYEGKAKKVFATEDPDIVIVDYKDDATAFNGEKKGTIVGKGVINNRMTNYVFQVLEKEGVPTHFVEELTYVKASYNSPYGLIKSAWERVGDKIIYKVTVPPGATATLHLEGENTPKELIAGTYKFEVNK